MNKLELCKITKRYTKKAEPAICDFSYSFENGVYGLLGPNGAGKSTLLNLIVGNLRPDQGTLCWNGMEIVSLGSEYRRILGYMPQQQQLFDNFSVDQFLWYFAALKGLKKSEAKERIYSLLGIVGLETVRKYQLKALSGGMKQRLLLAAALLNDPQIIIMDEPTAGLDPKERMKLKNYIYKLSQSKIVIIATHVISDIEQIAKEVIFLGEGKILVAGRPEQVIADVADRIWETEILKEAYPVWNGKHPLNRIVPNRCAMARFRYMKPPLL